MIRMYTFTFTFACKDTESVWGMFKFFLDRFDPDCLKDARVEVHQDA